MGKLIRLTVFFILLSLKLISQEYRIFYDYTYKKDSTKVDSIENRLMVLDIDKKGSIFYDYYKYKKDSLNIAMYYKDFHFIDVSTIKVNFFIEKQYPNFKTIMYTYLHSNNYAILDSTKLNWKLSSEHIEIKGYKAQKAMLNFGGRKWIAWYTIDIPFFEGPYKFSGLPGLILEVRDSENNHIFKFVGIEKNNTGYSNFFKIHKFNNKTINNKTFNKLWNEFKKDPAKNYKFSILNSSVKASMSFDGKSFSQNDVIRDIEKTEYEKIKKNNNFIELDLYK